MPVYNKLVRDKIPQIIESTGKTFTTKILSDKEYISELKKKSYEELEEYMNSTDRNDSLEELADILEIIHALALTHGSDITEIEGIRKDKAEKRGGFQAKIYLIEVDDD